MKTLLFLLVFFLFIKGNAQDYLIDFTGTKIPVDIIHVKNLTNGDSLILKGSDILNLKGNTEINNISDNHITSGMKIYPNPMTESTTIEIITPTTGDATVSVFDMSGKQIAQVKNYMDNSTQKYQLSGSGRGIYIVIVRGIGYKISGKLVCNGSGGTMSIEKISGNQAVKESGVSKGPVDSREKVMQYTPGDRLKFTASSGDYRTILTKIPDKSQTIAFDLIPVVDEDANKYHVVEIGDQKWMEENLKTTKYSDGTNIPLGLHVDSMNEDWGTPIPSGYNWYNNDIAFKNPYGALYNGVAVGNSELCPTGWHVPSVDEWVSLKDYLTINDYSYKSEVGAIAKSIASRSGWNVPQATLYHGYPTLVPDGDVGKDQQFNNSSGFNGFAAGMRDAFGTFTGIGDITAWYTNSGVSTIMNFSINMGSPILQQASDYSHAGFSVRCLKD